MSELPTERNDSASTGTNPETSQGQANATNGSDGGLPEVRQENQANNIEVREATYATRQDCFWVDMGYEGMRRTVPLQNETLARMVTISSAFIGGNLVLPKSELIRPDVSLLCLFAFIVSLASAMKGLYPVSVSVWLDSPDSAMDAEVETITRKQSHIAVSYAAFFTGIVIAFASMVVVWACKQFS